MAFLMVLAILAVGLTVSAYLVFRLRSSKSPGRRDGRTFVWACLICGPLTGAASAFWETQRNSVNPLDIAYTYNRSMALGFILSLVLALAILAADTLSARMDRREGKDMRLKS